MKTALSHPPACELQDVAPSDPFETIRRGSRLVSRKVGIIQRVFDTRYQAQDPVAFGTAVVPADFSRCLSGGVAVEAGGAGDTAAAATAAAIGEAVERHCACFSHRDELVVGTFQELSQHAVTPDLLRLYSRAQIDEPGLKGLDYFDERARIGWVWGYSLTSRRPRLVPASLVYLNYRPEKGEAVIGLNASTGLAAGTTREEAILSGLLETVERDAFTIAWMHRRAGRRIDIDDGEMMRTVGGRLRSDRPTVDVRFFDLTTDLSIPVVFLVMRRQAECGPVICVGASSRLSPRQAIHKCMLEAGQNFPYLRHLLDSRKDWHPAPDFSNVTDFDSHFLCYLKRPDLVPDAFAFFDQCEDRVAFSHMTDRSTGRVLADLEYCIERLGDAGYEVIVADITTPEIAEVGFSVVRVIVPGLVPLHSDHRYPFLGARRLSAVPYPLNPFPHPFP